MAQGPGAGTCRRGVEGGTRALTAEAPRSRTLAAGAAAILATADPAAKAGASRSLAEHWRAGWMEVGAAFLLCRPARPERPLLRPPKEMPKRRSFGSREGHIALLHALAHIELNAIDLAWDIVARPWGEVLPRAFYDDWVEVASEEALHFGLLAARLTDFGAGYGDLPAHDGLWESAAATAGDLLARLAVVPLVLEARGLDVTPEMAARLERAGDRDSAAVLHRIYRDEIGHVAIGARWFDWLCNLRGVAPEEAFRDQVGRCFKGRLKPPFNEQARSAAGFRPSYYEPLAERSAKDHQIKR